MGGDPSLGSEYFLVGSPAFSRNSSKMKGAKDKEPEKRRRKTNVCLYTLTLVLPSLFCNTVYQGRMPL